MDRTERFQKIQLMLQSRRVVTRQAFEEELEISRATFKRDLEYMKERLQVPIHWDAAAGGYRLAETDRQPLPGLWFNSEELQALLTLDTLLESLQPGYFGQDLAPIRSRIRQLVDQGDHGMDSLRTRVRLVAQGARRLEPASFKAVAGATLDRRRLQLTYFSRTSGLARTVKCRRSVCCITAKTGTSTLGVTAKTRCVVSPSTPWKPPTCRTRPPRTSKRTS